jgi:hypothetical protein
VELGRFIGMSYQGGTNLVNSQVLVTHPQVSYNRFPMDGALPWVCAGSHNPFLNTSTQLEIGLHVSIFVGIGEILHLEFDLYKIFIQ